MTIEDKGGGKYEITPAGDHAKKIGVITLTLDAKSVGNHVPYDAALPSGIPARYPDTPNGAAVQWLTNIKFRGNITMDNIPSFTLVLPYISGSTYVFYNEDNKKLSTMDDRKGVKGSTVTYHLDTNDPTVGMT